VLDASAAAKVLAWFGSAIMAALGIAKTIGARRVRKLEIERAWQESLLQRVETMERREAARDQEIDALERQLQMAQEENLRLRWRYDEIQDRASQQAAALQAATTRIAELEVDRGKLRAANDALHAELMRLYRDLQSGRRLTVPPRKPPT